MSDVAVEDVEGGGRYVEAHRGLACRDCGVWVASRVVHDGHHERLAMLAEGVAGALAEARGVDRQPDEGGATAAAGEVVLGPTGPVAAPPEVMSGACSEPAALNPDAGRGFVVVELLDDAAADQVRSALAFHGVRATVHGNPQAEAALDRLAEWTVEPPPKDVAGQLRAEGYSAAQLQVDHIISGAI